MVHYEHTSSTDLMSFSSQDLAIAPSFCQLCPPVPRGCTERFAIRPHVTATMTPCVKATMTPSRAITLLTGQNRVADPIIRCAVTCTSPWPKAAVNPGIPWHGHLQRSLSICWDHPRNVHSAAQGTSFDVKNGHWTDEVKSVGLGLLECKRPLSLTSRRRGLKLNQV